MKFKGTLQVDSMRQALDKFSRTEVVIAIDTLLDYIVLALQKVMQLCVRRR